MGCTPHSHHSPAIHDLFEILPQGSHEQGMHVKHDNDEIFQKNPSLFPSVAPRLKQTKPVGRLLPPTNPALEWVPLPTSKTDETLPFALSASTSLLLRPYLIVIIYLVVF
ncbi:hypothetical protein BLNAU_3482 [Blattamonas nauphoetae]|uniref:Uncharacterized protein n=1 Tax=Blattamonas nauphoetae TaxID=2049346 RepID=A0ABQ9YDL4_9EUKA|nr:hypothetical protein BLNAU_3482 [Blattamonas nauphoetae]